jgi:AraC-like DNA-binding protein
LLGAGHRQPPALHHGRRVGPLQPDGEPAGLADAEAGLLDGQWLLNQRLGQAQSLLESTDLPVERIAKLSGLGTANNLRHHFLKQIGISPSDYRRAFPRQQSSPERRLGSEFGAGVRSAAAS